MLFENGMEFSSKRFSLLFVYLKEKFCNKLLKLYIKVSSKDRKAEPATKKYYIRFGKNNIFIVVQVQGLTLLDFSKKKILFDVVCRCRWNAETDTRNNSSACWS